MGLAFVDDINTFCSLLSFLNEVLKILNFPLGLRFFPTMSFSIAASGSNRVWTKNNFLFASTGLFQFAVDYLLIFSNQGEEFMVRMKKNF